MRLLLPGLSFLSPLSPNGKDPLPFSYLLMSEIMSLIDSDITSFATLSFHCNWKPVKTVRCSVQSNVLKWLMVLSVAMSYSNSGALVASLSPCERWWNQSTIEFLLFLSTVNMVMHLVLKLCLEDSNLLQVPTQCPMALKRKLVLVEVTETFFKCCG